MAADAAAADAAAASDAAAAAPVNQGCSNPYTPPQAGDQGLLMLLLMQLLLLLSTKAVQATHAAASQAQRSMA